MAATADLELISELSGISATLDPKLLWHVVLGNGPTIGVAIHAGHEMRPELLSHLAIDEATRIREEDPYTDYWTLVCHNQIIARRSRFEVDLNRTLDEAICVEPEDCWNLSVWDRPIGHAAKQLSLAEHRAFYELLDKILRHVERKFGNFCVYDIHSYNHRRDGPYEPPSDPTANPQINIGTGTMNRARWAPLVERFIEDLRAFDFLGCHLDVRENVNFRGRNLAKFVHDDFPETGCTLAIEVKKFFMDEWTGVGSPVKINAMLRAFGSTIPGVTTELGRL